MGEGSIWILALALAADAFAAAVCKGLAASHANGRQALTVGLWFGGFQAGMPLCGWLLGVQFQGYITAIDHWIAFGLLALIGGHMVRESFCGGEPADASFDARSLLPLALATSVDALAVGVTFAFLQVRVWYAVAAIGVTTFGLSAAGVRLGGLLGGRLRAGAERTGGVVLILLGGKILLEHLRLI